MANIRSRMAQAAAEANRQAYESGLFREAEESILDKSEDEIVNAILSATPSDRTQSNLDTNPLFMAIGEEWTRAIGTRGDVFESLRDSDWSVSRAMTRAYNSRNWDERTQRNYRILRRVWEQTRLEGFGEWFNAIKDIGRDVVTDPVNFIGLPWLSRGIAAARGAGRATQATQTAGRSATARREFIKGELDQPLPSRRAGSGRQLELELRSPTQPPLSVEERIARQTPVAEYNTPGMPTYVEPGILEFIPRPSLKEYRTSLLPELTVPEVTPKIAPSRGTPVRPRGRRPETVQESLQRARQDVIKPTPRPLEVQLDLGLDPIEGQIPFSNLTGRQIKNNLQATNSYMNTTKALTDDWINWGLTGAIDGSVWDVSNQITENHSGIADSMDYLSTLQYAGMGALFGSTFNLIGNRFSKKAGAKITDDLTEETADASVLAQDAKDFIDADKEATRLGKLKAKVISSTVGRWTTYLEPYSKRATKLLNTFAESLNPQFKQGVLQATKTLTEAAKVPFHLFRDRTISTAENKISSAINKIKSKGEGIGLMGRLLGHKLGAKEDIALRNLITMSSRDFNQLLNLIKTADGDLSKILNAGSLGEKQQQFINRIVKDAGFDPTFAYTRDFVDASVTIRGVLDDLGKQASNIQKIDGGTAYLINPKMRIDGGYFPRYWSSKKFIGENRGRLEELIYQYKHADIIDDADDAVKLVLREIGEDAEDRSLRPDDVFEIDGQRFTFSQLRDAEKLSVDKEVFARHLEGVSGFKEKALRELEQEGKKGLSLADDIVEERAKRLKAKAIVDDMLQEGYASFDYAKPASALPFLKSRVFTNIPDHILVKEGFLQTTDLHKQLNSYIHGMGQAIAETKYFGRNRSEFKQRFLDPIKQELKNTGVDEDEAQKVLDYIQKGYETATNKKIMAKGTLRNIYEGSLLMQSLAHLPLAVISSITEPLLLIARTDLADLPQSFKIAKGIMTAQLKRTVSNIDVLGKKIAGKETRGYKTLREALDDLDWSEDFFEGFSAMENAAFRMASFEADSFQNSAFRKSSDLFFRANFLNTWTQSVRAASFAMAKARIRRLSRELATGQDSFGKKISPRRAEKNRQALYEIGIDANNAVNTYRRSVDAEGNFDLQKWRQSDFYQDEVVVGSQTFANEIILNADAAEAAKPLWMDSPGGRILFQFASYPTAFNNKILKRMINDVIKDPSINGPKVMSTVLLMAHVAGIGNTVRTGGRNLEDEDGMERAISAIDRAGLIGPASYIRRFEVASRYNSTFPAALMATGLGPVGTDLKDLATGRKGFIDVAINNAPFSGAVPSPLRRSLIDLAEEEYENIYVEPTGYTPFAKGGEVTNVPNVSPEPDEMKIRGLPYTYQQVAGGVMKETEDRLGFQEGGMVDDTDDFMEVYAYLTKDEKAYESKNKNPLELYSPKEIPSPSIDKEMYVSLPNNSYQSIFYEAREGEYVGLPVYESQMKADKPTRFKGYIKFNNPIDMNVEDTSPEAIEKALETTSFEKSYMNKDKTKRMIQDMKAQLTVRDDVLNVDPMRSSAKDSRMRESKSFIIRDTLLKLGFDAIKFNNGYALLKQNQFFPTEEIKIGFKKGGLVDRMRKRKGYAEGGEAESTSDLISSLLSNVTRATPEQEREYWQNPLEDFRWGETTDDNIVYLNTAKHEAEGSDEGWERDMFLGESLHRLNQVSPEWYNRLYQAAENDEDVQRWKQHSYDVSTGKAPDENGNYVSEEKRERRPIEDWWRVSRFDQLVGGWILGGEGARSKTMRNWNRDRLPYGTSFRKELEDFEDALGYRRGYAEGGLASSLLNYIVTARNLRDSRPLESYADAVAWQESRGRGPQTVQDNNGPARGKYQVEGSEGSMRNDTILQRAINFYDKYPDAPTSDEIQYALSQRGQDLDFSTLSEETQDALFYMDAERGRLPINDLYSGTLSNRDAWITYWNQDPNIADPEVRRRREEDWERAIQERMRNN
jgi:hypothetical protein